MKVVFTEVAATELGHVVGHMVWSLAAPRIERSLRLAHTELAYRGNSGGVRPIVFLSPMTPTVERRK